jgi:transcriptional regulator with XRE-family HTH domain
MTFDFDGKLCKAGRALAGWNQAELADVANVAKQTVADFERGARRPFPNNRRAIAKALQLAGVGFVSEGDGLVGVRWNAPNQKTGAKLVAKALRQP